MQSIELTIYLPFSYWLDRDPETGAPLTRPDGGALIPYLRALTRELASLGPDLEGCQATSLRFAGGYLSLLDSDALAALMAAVHRSLALAPDLEISGLAFPGALDMALLSQYRNYALGPLFFDVPSLSAQECRRLGLPNTLLALDQSVYLLQNYSMNNFGLTLPLGLPGRDQGLWLHLLGQITHYQPAHLALVPTAGADFQEHPALSLFQQGLLDRGWRLAAPGFYTRAPHAPRCAARPAAYVGVGLGAPSRLDGFLTRNTWDMAYYLSHSADYRQLIASVREDRPDAP